VLFEKYFGFADADGKVPVGRDTLFNIASGGKMFTALAIAKLAESGRLGYHDSIGKYVDGFADKAGVERITIRHLLSHTSGIGEYWPGRQDAAVLGAASTADHLRIVLQAGLAFAAGSGYAYCNSNYIVLGAIIEKVSGRSFHGFVEQEIFRIAGMSASGYLPHGAPGTAAPLMRDGTGNGWTEAPHGIRGSAAGGAYANAADMLKFSNSLRNYALVSGATLREMTTPKNGGLAAGEDYGYGFIIQKSAQETTYGHGGTANGVNFEFRYFPGEKITLVLFCNQNNGAYDDLKRNAIKLISGER
jgi:CubicO group peptidase (beta-lactamase class C family)